MNNREFINNHILKIKYMKEITQNHLSIIGENLNGFVVDNSLLFDDKYIILNKNIFLEYNNYKIFEDCDEDILIKWKNSKYHLDSLNIDNYDLNVLKLNNIKYIHKLYSNILPSIIYEDDGVIIFKKLVDNNKDSNKQKINIYHTVKELLLKIDKKLYITFNLNNFISDGKMYNNIININVNYFNIYYITDDNSIVYLLDKTDTIDYMEFVKKIFVNKSDFYITNFFEINEDKPNKNNILLNFMEEL